VSGFDSAARVPVVLREILRNNVGHRDVLYRRWLVIFSGFVKGEFGPLVTVESRPGRVRGEGEH